MSARVDCSRPIRFHPEVQQFYRSDNHAEEFPIRPLRPIKGRRPTMYVTATEISSEEDLLSEASDASDYAKLRSIVEGHTKDAHSRKDKVEKGLASRLASALRAGPKNKYVNRQDEITTTSFKSQTAQNRDVPIFADGLSLIQDKIQAEGENTSNPRIDVLVDKKKHAFARLVDAARCLKASTVRLKVEGSHCTDIIIASWIKARLLSLAEAAKARVQERIRLVSSAVQLDANHQKRDHTPSWNCKDLDHAAFLDEESPMSSLIPDVPLPTLRDASKISQKDLPEIDDKEAEGAIASGKVEKASTRLAENRLRFVDSDDEVIWIGRDGQVIEQAAVEKRIRHHHTEINASDLHSAGRHHRHHHKTSFSASSEDIGHRHHHHHHHHHHHPPHTQSHAPSRSPNESRPGKKSSDKIKGQSRRLVVTFEEHTKLEEAYGEAIKREVKSHLVHDAISLGGSTW